MANTSSEFDYFLALGNLTVTKSDTENYPSQTSVELEKKLKEQFRQINQEKLWLLVFEDYRVSWGYMDKQGWHFAPDAALPDPEYLQELRLFGEKGEFYLWRDESGFKGRLRTDSAPAPSFKGDNEMAGYSNLNQNQELPNYADEWQVLWGTQLGPNQGEGEWLTVSEARGAKFQLPQPLNNDKEELPLRLWVRHYINYDATNGLAYYNDMRLVGLRKKNLQPLGWL